MTAEEAQRLYPAPADTDGDDDENQQAQHLWLYHGRNGGWWHFEPHQNAAIEEIYAIYEKDSAAFDRNQHGLHIGAQRYTYDFAKARQYSAAGASRRIARTTRKELRDSQAKVKGIGGVMVVRSPSASAVAAAQ
jgi:hypothetical protein